MIIDSNGKQFPVPESDVVAAQAAAQTLNAKLAERRMILTADQLASLTAPMACHEVSYDRHQSHLYSINGILNGKKVKGALFAGECMLVFAVSESQAADLANRGLRATIELLYQEYAQRKQDDARTTLASQGTIVDAGGRRIGRQHAVNLPQRKKMEAMIRTVFGKIPFSW